MNDPIVNSSGEKLDYSFAAGAGNARQAGWIVILGHGVTGDKDRPVIADTAEALHAAGFDTIRFSFAGNGQSEGDFRQATVTKEVGDLNAVLDVVCSHYRRVCYIGHSMGNAVGVLQAARDPRINCLVSLAGMVDTKSFAEAEFGSEIPDAGTMWDDEDCPLSSAFMRDMCETVHTVAPQAGSISVPWLLLHGTADEVVNPRDTDLIERTTGAAVEVRRIDGAGHSFDEATHKQALTEAVVSWLRRQAE